MYLLLSRPDLILNPAEVVEARDVVGKIEIRELHFNILVISTTILARAQIFLFFTPTKSFLL